MKKLFLILLTALIAFGAISCNTNIDNPPKVLTKREYIDSLDLHGAPKEYFDIHPFYPDNPEKSLEDLYFDSSKCNDAGQYSDYFHSKGSWDVGENVLTCIDLVSGNKEGYAYFVVTTYSKTDLEKNNDPDFRYDYSIKNNATPITAYFLLVEDSIRLQNYYDKLLFVSTDGYYGLPGKIVRVYDLFPQEKYRNPEDITNGAGAAYCGWLIPAGDKNNDDFRTDSENIFLFKGTRNPFSEENFDSKRHGILKDLYDIDPSNKCSVLAAPLYNKDVTVARSIYPVTDKIDILKKRM